VSEQLLRRALREAEAPEAGAARARALQAALGARAERPPHAWATGLRPLAAALAALAIGLLLAFTPPGEAVADWVSRAVHARPAAKPVQTRTVLPSGGRLLASGGGKAWIVRADGRHVALGRWDGATWSPHGLFVGAWRGRTLAALEPDGDPRWSITAPARVRAAVWSPQGFHVVYRAGDRLRVVSGQGRGDSPLRVAGAAVGPVAPVTPAFRPAAPRTLAFVDRRGRVEVIDVYTGALLWRSAGHAPGGVRALTWTGDGARLVVLGRHSLATWTADGHALGRSALPAERVGVALAAAPRGRRVAVSRYDPATRRGEVVLGARRLFAERGHLTALAWSPDGRSLLASWPSAGMWLFLAPDGGARAVSALRQRDAILRGWSR
jgi:hypothetical protein